jgi:ABC-type multidrug transport system ATPase subunit
MQSLGFPTPWLTTPLAAMLGFWLMFSALAVGVLYLPPKAPSLVPQLKHTETTHDPVRPALPVRTCRDLTLESVSVSYLYTNLLRPGSSKLVFGPVSARFEPGTLTAILGPSGSGKTTLLQAVTGRLRGGFRTRFVRTGHIQVHGRQARESDMRSTCAFVPQSDHGLLHYLTVRETLQYAARLRLPANLEEEDVSAHAESVLSELGLTPCADTIVGNSRIRGISGGEKRRLSIAVQILANPAVLVLDEPTSGLDAFTAMTVMQTLRSLASQGRTVITVVHQPRWAFMETCDKILMLSHNGGQAFFGSADELTVQLEVDRETSLPTANPADLALDRLAESHKTCSNSAVPTWTWTAGAGNSKQEGLPMSIRVVSSRSRPTSVPVATSHISSYPKNRCTPGFSTVLWILMQRSLVKCRRAPRLFLSRIMQIVGAGMIVVLFFTPLGHDSAAAQTRVGIIAQSSSLFFVGMLNAIAIYPSDLDLFLQEFGDSLYGAEAFLTSYTLIELPLEMLGASLLSLLVVFATKLSERFEVYLVIAYTSFAIINCGESLGIMFLSFIEHTALALSVMSVVLSTCTALNGAFSLDMLSWIGALNSLSPSKWQVQAALSSSLRGVKFSCDDTELLDHGECPVSSGDQLLELYNMDVSTAKAACILAAVTIGYRLLAYIALKIRCRISTRG